MYHSVTRIHSTIGRFVRHYSRNPLSKVLVQLLPSRTLLRIAGPTAADYLQGLITNDVKHIIEGATSMFAMFLNTKGRVLYDTIIYSGGEADAYLIECDTEVAKDLELHLKRYKVRRKLSIEVMSDLSLWAVNSKDAVDDIINNVNPIAQSTEAGKTILAQVKDVKNIKAVADPRTSALGIRVILPKSTDILTLLKPTSLDAEMGEFYRLLRHKMGVGEGVVELPTGSCFPLEANCDYLHGVSFHKGCYIGQELTARTHHTGVIRKRLMPLMLKEKDSDLAIDSTITADSNEKSVGKLRGYEGVQAIALLRVEEVLKAKYLEVGGKRCATCRPFWWPSEAPKGKPS